MRLNGIIWGKKKFVSPHNLDFQTVFIQTEWSLGAIDIQREIEKYINAERESFKDITNIQCEITAAINQH